MSVKTSSAAAMNDRECKENQKRIVLLGMQRDLQRAKREHRGGQHRHDDSADREPQLPLPLGLLLAPAHRPSSRYRPSGHSSHFGCCGRHQVLPAFTIRAWNSLKRSTSPGKRRSKIQRTSSYLAFRRSSRAARAFASYTRRRRTLHARRRRAGSNPPSPVRCRKRRAAFRAATIVGVANMRFSEPPYSACRNSQNAFSLRAFCRK